MCLWYYGGEQACVLALPIQLQVRVEPQEQPCFRLPNGSFCPLQQQTTLWPFKEGPYDDVTSLQYSWNPERQYCHEGAT